MKPTQTLVVAVGLSLTILASAAERNLSFSQLPDVVQKAATEVIKDAKVIRVLEEKEKTAFYTVEYEGRGGRKFEVEISPDGKVIESGELVNVADTPEPAKKKIEEKTKSVAWMKVIKATEEGKTVYIVKFDRGGDDEDQFTVDAKGNIHGK